VERREGLAHLHRHDGVRRVVELDLGDRAHRLPADAHLVAGHELAGILEDGLDPVRAAAAEHREGGQRHRCDQRRGREDACRGGAALTVERLASPSLSFLRVQARSIDRRLPQRAADAPT
jgi:hypothetical protein